MKTNTIRSIKPLVLSALLLLGCAGFSRAQSKTEVSVAVNGSFSKLDYEVLGHNNEMESGWGIGLQYAHYFNKNWSIGTGLEYQSYQGTAKIASLQDAYATEDLEGEAFEFRYTATNYEEQQRASYLNLPLKLQYETSGAIRFFVAAGAKVGFNLRSEYQAEANSLVTSGYYPQFNAELHAPEFAGYGDFGAYRFGSSPLDLRTSFLATLESGVKFLLESQRSFYLGLFLDYGLNDINEKAGEGNIVEYSSENPSSFSGNSLLTAVNNSTAVAYTEEVKQLAFGLKLRYAFGL